MKDLNEQAKKQVGDGRRPNRFFVTASNDLLIETLDGNIVSLGTTTLYRGISVTLGVYKSNEDAICAADELFDTMQRDPSGRQFWVNSVAVEDRLNGTIYEVQRQTSPSGRITVEIDSLPKQLLTI